MQKGMLVNIYRDRYTCDLNVTDAHNLSKIIVVDPAMPQIFEADEQAPAFKIVRRNLANGLYLHLEPVENPSGRSYMFGGHFAHTCDSRWCIEGNMNSQPLPIHDRQE